MKKYILIILGIIILTGCTTKKFYLTDKYYNEGKFIQNYNIEDNYIIYTYNNYCTFEKPCEETFQDFMDKYKIDIVSMPFEQFKKTKFYETVKYGPSIIIIKKGKIIAYLDPNSDIDLEKYQNEEKFEEWIKDYIYFERQK